MHPELREHLEALARLGRLSGDQRDELEDHLISALEHGLERGLDEAAAAVAALTSLGPVGPLAMEFRKERSMNPLSRLAGIAIVLGAIVLVAVPAGYFRIMIDVPSALLVSGVVLGGLVASFGPRAILRAVRQAFAREPMPGRDTANSLRLFQHGYRLCWAAGVLGSILGVIGALANLEDPAGLGGALALGLLSLLYGALLAELVFANLAQWLQAGAEQRAVA
jgi:hypothetical protein